MLLCNDLHSDYVLATRCEPWLVIDPKPYLGDPTYDPLQHMLNFPGPAHCGPRQLRPAHGQLLELDAERLRQWFFARCLQESPDQPHLQSAAIELAP